jgi:hypothetical protein
MLLQTLQYRDEAFALGVGVDWHGTIPCDLHGSGIYAVHIACWPNQGLTPVSDTDFAAGMQLGQLSFIRHYGRHTAPDAPNLKPVADLFD